MACPRARDLENSCWIIPNLDRQRCWTRGEGVDGDLVKRDLRDGIGCVTGLVARCSVSGACRVGVGFVVVNNPFFRDGWGAAVFIDGDVVREDVAPGIMRIVGDVAGGVGYDAAWSDGADVVAFSVVIPRYDLEGNLSCVILYVLMEFKPRQIQALSEPLGSIASTTDHRLLCPSFCYTVGGWYKTREKLPSYMAFPPGLPPTRCHPQRLLGSAHEARHPS